MAALTCDVCGGKLVMGAGGIAVCDSCGMEHSTDRMKEKVQEIKGTVTVSNIAGIESLMKRGNLAVEDSNWHDAYGYFNKVLDIDAEYAPAYIGKLRVELNVKNEADLATYKATLDDKPNYQKAIRFADADYCAKLENINKANKEHVAEENQQKQECVAKQKNRVQEQNKYKNCFSAGASHTVGLKTDGTVVAVGYYQKCKTDDWRDIVMIATGPEHTVGLKADGTVVAVGYDDKGRCKTDDWSGIVAVAAGEECTVGLRADGTVFTAVDEKWNSQLGMTTRSEQVYTEKWRDIVAVAVGKSHTAALKADGTVVAVGLNKRSNGIIEFHGGQCDTGKWHDIVAVSVGNEHTVGLKADGTIVLAGYIKTDLSKVDYGWKDIVAVYAVAWHTVGLKADGTVVAEGINDFGQMSTKDWRDIVAVAAGYSHTVGLKADGTVVAVGENGNGRCNVSGWRDIVAVAAGDYHTAGLKADGTVVAVGENKDGQCDVGEWSKIGPVNVNIDKNKLLKLIADENRKKEEKQRLIEQAIRWNEQGLCWSCGGQIGGLLQKKCKSCGKPFLKDAEEWDIEELFE